MGRSRPRTTAYSVDMKSVTLPLRHFLGFFGALALGGIEVDTCAEIVHRLRDGSLKPHRNDDVVDEKPQQHVLRGRTERCR